MDERSTTSRGGAGAPAHDTGKAPSAKPDRPQAQVPPEPDDTGADLGVAASTTEATEAASDARAESLADTILADTQRALEGQVDAETVTYRMWDDRESDFVGDPLPAQDYLATLELGFPGETAQSLQRLADHHAETAKAQVAALRSQDATAAIPASEILRYALVADMLNRMARERREAGAEPTAEAVPAAKVVDDVEAVTEPAIAAVADPFAPPEGEVAEPTAEEVELNVGTLQNQRTELMNFFQFDPADPNPVTLDGQAWNKVIDRLFEDAVKRNRDAGLTGEDLHAANEAFDEQLDERRALLASIEARLQDAGAPLVGEGVEAPEAPERLLQSDAARAEKEALGDTVGDRDVEHGFFARGADADAMAEVPMADDEELLEARAEMEPGLTAEEAAWEDEHPTTRTVDQLSFIGEGRPQQTYSYGYGSMTHVDQPRPAGVLHRRRHVDPEPDVAVPPGVKDLPTAGPDSYAETPQEEDFASASEDPALMEARAERLPALDPEELAEQAPIRGSAGLASVRRGDQVSAAATGFGGVRQTVERRPAILERRQRWTREEELEAARNKEPIITDDSLEDAQRRAEMQPLGGLQELQARYAELQTQVQALVDEERKIMTGMGRVSKILMKTLGRVPPELREVQDRIAHATEMGQGIANSMADVVTPEQREAAAHRDMPAMSADIQAAAETGEQSEIAAASAQWDGAIDARMQMPLVESMQSERDEMLTFFGMGNDRAALEGTYEQYGPRLEQQIDRMVDEFETTLRRSEGIKGKEALTGDLADEVNSYEDMLRQRAAALQDVERRTLQMRADQAEDRLAQDRDEMRKAQAVIEPEDDGQRPTLRGARMKRARQRHQPQPYRPPFQEA